jgi:hypothetical protein
MSCPADDLAEEAFVVLRDALEATKKVGDRPACDARPGICRQPEACGRGMVLETLRYADEVNKAASYFRDIGDTKPDADLLDMAETLIDKKTSEFDAKEFENRYIDALKKLIAEKQKKKGKRSSRTTSRTEPKGSNVIDLMAALKKSLATTRKPERRPQAGSQAGAAQTPAKKARTRHASGPEPWPQPKLDIETYNRKRDFKERRSRRAASSRARATASSSRSMTLAAALGLPAGAGRGAEELGGSQGPIARSRRQEARGPDRGPSARLWRIRRSIPKGEYGGGNRDAVGPGRWEPEPARIPARRSRKAISTSRSKASG